VGFFVVVFKILFERKRESTNRGSGRQREKQAPHWQGAGCGTQSQDPRIMT